MYCFLSTRTDFAANNRSIHVTLHLPRVGTLVLHHAFFGTSNAQQLTIAVRMLYFFAAFFHPHSEKRH